MANQKPLIKRIYGRLLHWLWRLQCTLRPNQVYTFSVVGGGQISYPLRTAVGQALFTKSFETAELNFITRSLKPGDVFIDVGANAGIFSVVGAKIVGSKGCVVAFEPGGVENDLLRRNIEANQLKNVTLVDCAVSNAVGEAQFAVSKDGAMSSLRKTNHPGQTIVEWRKVKTTTLDQFLSQSNIAKVDFIKIDVEGGEKFVLEGARHLLKSARNLTVLFEASDLNAAGFGYSVKDFLSELRNMGLKLFYFGDRGDLVAVIDDDPRFGNEIYNFVAKV